VLARTFLLRNTALTIIWSLRMQVVRADLVFFRTLGLRVPKRSHLGLTGSPSCASTCAPSASGLGQLPGGASEVAHGWT
jgi:hypothetical protein